MVRPWVADRRPREAVVEDQQLATARRDVHFKGRKPRRSAGFNIGEVHKRGHQPLPGALAVALPLLGIEVVGIVVRSVLLPGPVVNDLQRFGVGQ